MQSKWARKFTPRDQSADCRFQIAEVRTKDALSLVARLPCHKTRGDGRPRPSGRAKLGWLLTTVGLYRFPGRGEPEIRIRALLQRCRTAGNRERLQALESYQESELSFAQPDSRGRPSLRVSVCPGLRDSRHRSYTTDCARGRPGRFFRPTVVARFSANDNKSRSTSAAITGRW